MPETEFKHYYIVKEHPVRIITKCKSHSNGTLLRFLIGFCMLYAVISWVPQILSLFIPATNLDLAAAYTDVDPALLKQLPATSIVVIIYTVFFSGVFKLSECLYDLTYIRNRQVDYRALTESFPYYLKTLRLYVIMMLIIAFWSMFFVIPGIIVALNFSQAFYILADDPDKGVADILTESKIMMRGNRLNYVRLMIYYAPYIMLAYIPAFLVAPMTMNLGIGQAGSLAALFITDIPIFAVMGLISMGKTVFYELMINKGFAEFRYAGQEAFRELEKR